VINMGQQIEDYPSAEAPEIEGEGASSELPSFMQADATQPVVEDVAEIAEPEPVAEAPEIAEEADDGELPGFLREPKLAPRREVSKRSRSFLDRVLGTNRQPPKEESRLATDPIEEAEPLENNERVEPRLEETAEIARRDIDDAPALDQRPAAILDAPEAIPAEPAPMVAAAPTQNEPKLDLDAPEAPAPAAKVEMPGPQVLVNSVAPTPTIAEQAPVVQTQMQTAPSMNASYEADQLDIPAFLRR
jgi:hypothetical protein